VRRNDFRVAFGEKSVGRVQQKAPSLSRDPSTGPLIDKKGIAKVAKELI